MVSRSLTDDVCGAYLNASSPAPIRERLCCPIEQGEQLFSALCARQQTVELIRFPNASHVIASTASPHHRYFQWKLTLDWFETHLKTRGQ